MSDTDPAVPPWFKTRLLFGAFLILVAALIISSFIPSPAPPPSTTEQEPLPDHYCAAFALPASRAASMVYHDLNPDIDHDMERLKDRYRSRYSARSEERRLQLMLAAVDYGFLLGMERVHPDEVADRAEAHCLRILDNF